MRYTDDDGLTGAIAQWRFQKLLPEELEAHRASGETLGLLGLDVYAFLDAINRRYGYVIGDHVLRHAAQIAMQTAPEAAIGRRWPGTFVGMVPRSTKVETAAIADRIAKAVEKSPIAFLYEGESQEIHVTCRFTVAAVDSTEADSPAALLETLRARLDAAKAERRREDVRGALDRLARGAGPAPAPTPKTRAELRRGAVVNAAEQPFADHMRAISEYVVRRLSGAGDELPYPYEALVALAAHRTLPMGVTTNLLPLLTLVGRGFGTDGAAPLNRMALVMRVVARNEYANVDYAKVAVSILRHLPHDRYHTAGGSPDPDKDDRDSVLEAAQDRLAEASVEALARHGARYAEPALEALAAVTPHRNRELRFTIEQVRRLLREG